MTRRTATAEDVHLDAVLFKGNGKTAWRVTDISQHVDFGPGVFVRVVKATTVKVPARSCWLHADAFTVEDSP